MNRRKAGQIIFFEWSVPLLLFFGDLGWLAGVRGERPAGCARDAGRVPLSSRATAKGGQPMTQLAALRQVSSVVQRSHPRAKRNQLPGSRHSRPDARRWHCWEWDARRRHRCFLREIDVSGERNVEKVTMLRVQHHGGVEHAVFP